jgi:hypothetical protein
VSGDLDKAVNDAVETVKEIAEKVIEGGQGVEWVHTDGGMEPVFPEKKDETDNG